MSDRRERLSRAVRHVRPSAQAGGWGLGELPNKHIGNGKGYPDDLLAVSEIVEQLDIGCNFSPVSLPFNKILVIIFIQLPMMTEG